MKRPLSNMVPASVTTHTKPLVGVVCENILNLFEFFGLLTLLPSFEEHERELLQVAEGASSSPDTLHETANNLQVIKQIWLHIFLPRYSRFVVGLWADCNAPKL